MATIGDHLVTAINRLVDVANALQPADIVLTSPLPVQVVLPDGTIVGAAPTAASEAPGRTHVDAALENQTTTQTVYTITAGKTFWLAGFSLSMVNSGLGALGRIGIYDDETLKIPFIVPAAVLGAITPAVSGSAFSLAEPIPFTTSVRAVVLGGTLNYSVAIVGYEQDE